ncbi:hypothetical protein JR316_0000898 [Psilocybe cubensis]|uniref:Uncharacterized protein n=2 Tax=Psilocybe cubensis TaxID=181762 RepID=A0ACB8HFZ6_PSICU|nr:hypothetical protein JR316_0000898 [Psilocybe cubensis]KAH9486833.1 hypothetical protein JR316_0000898 [Psilocybe cubensis]
MKKTQTVMLNADCMKSQDLSRIFRLGTPDTESLEHTLGWSTPLLYRVTVQRRGREIKMGSNYEKQSLRFELTPAVQTILVGRILVGNGVAESQIMKPIALGTMTTDKIPAAVESKPSPGQSSPDLDNIGEEVLNAAETIEVVEDNVVELEDILALRVTKDSEKDVNVVDSCVMVDIGKIVVNTRDPSADDALVASDGVGVTSRVEMDIS